MKAVEISLRPTACSHTGSLTTLSEMLNIALASTTPPAATPPTTGYAPALAATPLDVPPQPPADPDGYAHGVYAALRELDQAGNEVIVVEAIPDAPEWAAVADRMRRAACGSGTA